MIFSSIDELRSFIPLMTFDDIAITEAHTRRAFYKYFPVFIGRSLMSRIDCLTPDPVLIDKIKPPLANFSILEAIPFLDLVLTGSGFAIVSNQNLLPASKERVDRLVKACSLAGTDGLDELLFFLEMNTSFHNEWNKCCLIPDGLIPNAAVFQSFIDIRESRTKFFALRDRLIAFQKIRIERLTGEALLRSLIADNTDNKVLPLLRHALASMVKATESPELMPQADELLMMAMSYITAHLDEYPVYRDTMHESPFENNADNGFLMLGR
jgi:hypothetical protein